MVYILYLIYIVLIVVPIYLIFLIKKMNKETRKAEWLNSHELTTIRIDVPRNNDKSALAAEQMFASLHGIYSEKSEFQSQISFEIVSRDKYLQFFVNLPRQLKAFVEGQIYAQYPNVEINEVEDYTTLIDRNSNHFSTCELKLTKPDVYPIKTFTDFEVDPLSGITSVMTNLMEGEQIWLQMIVKPVGDEWQEKGNDMVQSVRSGRKLNANGVLKMISKEIGALLINVAKQLFRPGSDMSTATAQEVKLPGPVEDALKAIEGKIVKLGFATKIRVLAIAKDEITAKVKCHDVVATFKQFNTTNLNGFKAGDVVNSHEDWIKYQKRLFADDGNIFNISELASVYHFPHSSVSTPNIVWSGSKKGEPPANLPMRSNTPLEDFTVLGETNFRNAYVEFGIKRDDRRRHIYIVGKSGVGKSVLIENMAITDVLKGSGVVIVDPHGELAEKILACIPDERVDDVVVFDPSDREFPIAFNLLEAVDDDFKSLVASGFVGIFKKIFGNSWGPRLEHILRNTVLALLDFPDSTMIDIPRMLTNKHFQDKVLEYVKDPVIKEFWINEFGSFDSKFKTEAVSPILNKVGQFLASSTIRNIVSQPKSRIDIREIMDQEKIMIINLSRGKIGEDNSALLGAMMITKIQLAAMSRANVTVDKRPDCFLYVDEFQNFATDAFGVILSEARKYNLALTIAHQYVKQLPEELSDAIFGNAGTLISFRVGGADADVLVKEYEPVFEANDLVNLDKYNIYIKLLVDGISAPAFSARTLPPVMKVTGNAEKVVSMSRVKYATSRSKLADLEAQRIAEEKERMRAEAEAFKSGGLEALLSKKVDQYPKTNAQYREEYVSPVVSSKPEAKQQNTEMIKSEKIENYSKPNIRQDDRKQEIKIQNQSQSAVEEENKNSKKIFRHENILADKIYKERTARGGIKWYIGEEINLEKLKEQGIEITDEAMSMIQNAKKVADMANSNKQSGSVTASNQQIIAANNDTTGVVQANGNHNMSHNRYIDKSGDSKNKAEIGGNAHKSLDRSIGTMPESTVENTVESSDRVNKSLGKNDIETWPKTDKIPAEDESKESSEDKRDDNNKDDTDGSNGNVLTPGSAVTLG